MAKTPAVPEAEFTLHEAAELLGVHYMTAYRYVRLGLLDAYKVGGTWRVNQTGIDTFRVRAVTEESRGTTSVSQRKRRAPWADRLERRLLAGDSQGSWGVIEAALASGASLDEIYRNVLSPAMVSIGQRWERGELDVAVEHAATVIAMRIIGRLGPRFAHRGRTRGTVVLAAPAHETHSLPVAMLADLVRQAGWNVIDLGADVPAESLVRAAMIPGDVVAVGLSVSNTDRLDSTAYAVAALRKSLPGTRVVLGGHAIAGREHAVALGAHDFAADVAGFVLILESVGA